MCLLDLILSSDPGFNISSPLGEIDYICLKFKLLLSQQKEEFIPINNVLKTQLVVKETSSEYDWLSTLNCIRLSKITLISLHQH